MNELNEYKPSMRDDTRREIMTLRYARGITRLDDIENVVSQTLIDMAKSGDVRAIGELYQ